MYKLREICCTVAVMMVVVAWGATVAAIPASSIIVHPRSNSTVGAVAVPPEQIHLSLTGRVGELSVDFVTNSSAQSCASTLQYGPTVALGSKATGVDLTFQTYQVHTAVMVKLEADTTYYFQVETTCGSLNQTFVTHYLPSVTSYGPGATTAAVFADLGLFAGTPSCASSTSADAPSALLADLKTQNYSYVIHAGDIAYNLADCNNDRGNLFMRSIEPIASRVPYYVIPGNHEADADMQFQNYLRRFRGLELGVGATSNSKTSRYVHIT